MTKQPISLTHLCMYSLVSSLWGKWVIKQYFWFFQYSYWANKYIFVKSTMLNFLEKLDYLIAAKNTRKEDASFHFGDIYNTSGGWTPWNEFMQNDNQKKSAIWITIFVTIGISWWKSKKYLTRLLWLFRRLTNCF